MKDNNNLAKLSLGINAVLIVLVIIIFMTFNSNDTAIAEVNEDDTTVVETEQYFEPSGKMGFFNLDSLNTKLDLFKEIEQEMQNSAKAAEKKMKNKQTYTREEIRESILKSQADAAAVLAIGIIIINSVGAVALAYLALKG